MARLSPTGQAKHGVNLRDSDQDSFENGRDSDETIDVEAQTSNELRRKRNIISILGRSRSCPVISVRLVRFVGFICE